MIKYSDNSLESKFEQLKLFYKMLEKEGVSLKGLGDELLPVFNFACKYVPELEIAKPAGRPNKRSDTQTDPKKYVEAMFDEQRVLSQVATYKHINKTTIKMACKKCGIGYRRFQDYQSNHKEYWKRIKGDWKFACASYLVLITHDSDNNLLPEFEGQINPLISEMKRLYHEN